MTAADEVQEALRSGSPLAALARCRRALAESPSEGGLHYLAAIARQASGQAEAAETDARRAVAIGGVPADAHLVVAMQLAARGEGERALAAFERAIALAPDRAIFRMLKASVLIQLRRYEDAYEDLLVLLIERRSSTWWPPGLPDPPSSVPDSEGQVTSRLKLRHDAEQLAYLRKVGRLPPRSEMAFEAFERVLADLESANVGNEVVHLTEAQAARLAPFYNRVLTLDPGERIEGGAVAQGWDREAAVRAFAADRVAVIDDLLTPQALAALRRVCLESTIWFDAAHALGARGYIGADGIDGFASPLIFQVAEDLRAALPEVIGELPLVKFWAFKYDHALQGINAHADAARVNVNFWLTPSDANLDPASGGLMVWNTHVPRDWGFEAYNNDPDGLMRRIEEIGAKPVNVPHRQNRAVIFDSDLIHATAPLSFRPGYENRRLNVTLLFGHRGS